MTMDMHMLGAMYAPTDRVTLMLMANYLEQNMAHVTYRGGWALTCSVPSPLAPEAGAIPRCPR